jgi:hypothetical protein
MTVSKADGRHLGFDLSYCFTIDFTFGINLVTMLETTTGSDCVPGGDAGGLVVQSSVAAGFCLPDGIELVGFCARGAGSVGDRLADGRVAGDKRGNG